MICAVALKVDANMLETASTQYAVRDIRVVMLEPLVRVLAVIEAVYNGVKTHNLPACGLHMLR